MVHAVESFCKIQKKDVDVGFVVNKPCNHFLRSKKVRKARFSRDKSMLLRRDAFCQVYEQALPQKRFHHLAENRSQANGPVVDGFNAALLFWERRDD